jgi:hypothetical protein
MRLGKLLSVGEATDREQAGDAAPPPEAVAPEVAGTAAPVSAGR